MVCPRVGHNWTGISHNPFVFPLGNHRDIRDLVQVTGREFTLKKGPKMGPKKGDFRPLQTSQTMDFGDLGPPRGQSDPWKSWISGGRMSSNSWISVYFGIKSWISGYRDTLETLDFSMLTFKSMDSGPPQTMRFSINRH